MVTIELPSPPSTNNLYKRVLNKAGKRPHTNIYAAWIEAAGWELVAQKPGKMLDNYRLTIRVAPGFRADLDNGVKAISDLLVTHEVTPDDRHMHSLHVWKAPFVAPGRCLVTVSKADGMEVVDG